jgi:transcriptional regulator with XRE-family HTH domain
MTITDERPRLNAFACMLGDELRRTRLQRGWSRRDLLGHLQSRISIQTIATYEAGSRQCSVARLVELCQAMGVHAHELLARVHQRTEIDMPGRLMLDLHQVAQDQQTALMPLRRWAQERLNQADRDKAAPVPLEVAALESLAQLCDMTTMDLIRRLRWCVHPAR